MEGEGLAADGNKYDQSIGAAEKADVSMGLDVGTG